MRRRSLIVVIAIIFTALLYGSYSLFSEARFAADRRYRALNMFEAMVSITNYDDVYKRLPSSVSYSQSGKPLGSWRAELLHLVGTPETLPNAKLPWDDPANAVVTKYPRSPFCFGEDVTTNIVAIIGKGSAFDASRAYSRSVLPHDTLLLIEVARSGIPWAAPGDIDVEHIPPSITLGTDGIGVHVAFADQAVWYLSADVPVSALRLLSRPTDAAKHDRDVILSNYVLEKGL